MLHTQEKLRSLYLDSVLRVLNNSKIAGSLEIVLNCKVKDLKELNALNAQKAFISHTGASLKVSSSEANTHITLNVVKG